MSSHDKNYQLIDQTKPNRTPFRTFFLLLRYGQFKEIIRIFGQKFRTFFYLLTTSGTATRKTLTKLPIFRKHFQRKYLKDILYIYYGYSPRRGKDQISVALILRNGTTRPQSSAFIRLISPLTDPIVKDKIYLRIFPENSHNIGKGWDVCIVQRNAFDDLVIAKTFVRNLKSSGTSIIIDSDDSFSTIDPSHPEHDSHHGRMDAFNYLLENADQVWFSTESLANTHKELAHKIRIVPNSLDQRVWGAKKRTQRKPHAPLKFVYMGTATHASDLNMILPILDTIWNKHPDSFELSIIGITDNLPERIWIKRVVQLKGSLYPNFVKWFLDHSKFDFGLSPLVDSEFNRSKSDIKCLDYIAAGIIPVVSDVTPYKSSELNDFIFRVKNTPDAWENVLTKLVTNLSEIQIYKNSCVIAGQKYLYEKRNSTTIAKRLYDYLEELKTKKA